MRGRPVGVTERLSAVRASLAQACAEAGRPAQSVRLLAVLLFQNFDEQLRQDGIELAPGPAS